MLISIILAIISIVISVAAIIISVLSHIDNQRHAEKLQNEANKHAEKLQHTIRKFENRPIITYKNIIIDPKEFKIYQGENVKWPVKNSQEWQLENKDSFVEKIFELSSTNTKTNLDKDINEYMLINLCSEDFRNIENRNVNDYANLVVCSNVLKIVLDFGVSTVKEVKIMDVYSMRGNNQSFPDIELNAVFDKIKGSTLEVRVAYAAINNDATSLGLYNINKYVNNNNEPIDLLVFTNKASKYINFVETGYWIQCKTTDNDTYDYSLILEMRKGILFAPKPTHGYEEFFSYADKARKTAKRDVIQYS